MSGCGTQDPSDQRSANVGAERIVRAVDGDTVELASGETVRILGIDTPERGQCGYTEATESLQSLAERGEMRLERAPGGPNTDPYDRLLRHVFVGGTDVALAQIEAGWANARYDSRDGYSGHRYEAQYRAADETVAHRCPQLD